MHLESTGECIFDCKRSDYRLMPIIFNSRTNLDHEEDYPSFVGEIACGRWDIIYGVLYFIGYVIVT